jgi:hypothetical protein
MLRINSAFYPEDILLIVTDYVCGRASRLIAVLKLILSFH